MCRTNCPLSDNNNNIINKSSGQPNKGPDNRI